MKLRSRAAEDSGFTLVDMVAVTALVGILSAIAVPTMISAVNGMRLGQAAHEVERELQMAKQKAVGKGRTMRIRFNCPVAGQYRITELIGLAAAPAAADTAANRCSDVVYPFPPDGDPLTLPNLDGPIRRLDSSVTFSTSQIIEFWPDGTAHYNTGVLPWGMIPVAGISIKVSRAGKTSTITVNGIGKIQLQP